MYQRARWNCLNDINEIRRRNSGSLSKENESMDARRARTTSNSYSTTLQSLYPRPWELDKSDSYFTFGVFNPFPSDSHNRPTPTLRPLVLILKIHFDSTDLLGNRGPNNQRITSLKCRGMPASHDDSNLTKFQAVSACSRIQVLHAIPRTPIPYASLPAPSESHF